MKLFYCLLLFSMYNLLYATDYAKQENWAALPTMQDNADWTPTGLANKQDSARADVFFIHPTSYFTAIKGNASIDDKMVNKQTDKFSIKYQASVFNESCKVYAPRYRQAALNNFFTSNKERAQLAFDTAYADVKQAFEYYLLHYNNGRPIIIAGHSQGSKHAQRLLREFFDGKALQKQLVEAYIIGFPTHENMFQYLKVSDTPDSYGTYVSFSTFGQNSKIESIVPEYTTAVSVNPLSWTTDNTFVSGQANKGSLSPKNNHIIHDYFGAKNTRGIVEIQKPADKSFVSMVMKNYHHFDYSLFYMNIRENIALRINNFLKHTHQ
ncbi:MAG TPA: DUF3089 domain-containing protein [Chitinophagales bacterium]|nr:DUF3089 domain-containing protein [Chitinophagales bacterium]HNA37948.1 DUF3089 domain-containing protein [Chitinophagales bacterium]HNF18726.1 DUF3089 domain-containing protein [Chitinophagales bacterium]HNG71464.1 DUF3089 domain-containing protein [Chitinophagales bacterium]HNJ01420.1 DUF3089 domain-containing protein [Chitinophagales bacterium]